MAPLASVGSVQLLTCAPMARNIAMTLQLGCVHVPTVKQTQRGLGAPGGRASCFPISLQPQPHN